MIIVADAGPLHYLILIGAVDVLAPLYDRVLVPETVIRELQHARAPGAVRTWLAQPRAWFEICPDPPADPGLAFLDAGEQAGRAAAEGRHLRITGTLGVLAEAHQAGLLDFETQLAQLRQTNFYASPSAVARVRRRLSTGTEKA